MEHPRILVVVPTFNEAANLPELIRRLMALPTRDLCVLIVDDDSPDGTADIAERLGAQHDGRVRVLRHQGRGLGLAYRDGFREALATGARSIAQMDADLSHPPEDLPRMLALLDTADVVVGSRWTPGGETERWSRVRRWLSRSASRYAAFVLGLDVRDTTSGFKCYRREALEALHFDGERSRGFMFQVETAYLCKRAGLRVAEAPIRFEPRRKGASKLGLRTIAEIVWRVPALRLQR
ncbi:MAG: polyprenol monophosphomannose synthase [Chloroflexi bacterium]|nr:polyprenol monophosphomannose synthase [Chloroflexota bacterium]